LAASIPLIAKVVLAFGSPEFFAIALFGLLCVSVLSSRQMLKGMLMAATGLLISTVGTAPENGQLRFTFGLTILQGGFGLVAVTIGLYGVAEIVHLWIKRVGIAETSDTPVGDVWRGCRDAAANWALTVRCSILGVLLGVIPGLGGSMSQWFAYAHSIQSSRDKSQFGKGDVRGVIGPSATTNSREGGNLITMVSFGIPATVSMAILLGAFEIQGIAPGPDMLSSHLNLTMSFVWIIILAHIISIGLCFIFIKPMVRITRVRGVLIIPCILLLALFGGYSENETTLGIFTAVGAGLVGVAMVNFNWPRPPLILGLVLGPIIESNLFKAYGRYQFRFLLRPIVLGIILLGLAVIVAPAVYKRLRRSHRENPVGDGESGSATDQRDARLLPDTEATVPSAAGTGRGSLFFGVGCVVFMSWIAWQALGLEFSAKLLPLAVALPGLCLAVVSCLVDGRRVLRDRGSERPDLLPVGGRRSLLVGDHVGVVQGDNDAGYADRTGRGSLARPGWRWPQLRGQGPHTRRQTAQMIGWVALCGAMVVTLGFPISAAVFPVLFLKLGARERWRTSLLAGVAVCLFFVLVFGTWLHVQFPPGWLLGGLPYTYMPYT
jgi:TctA family transporter